MIDWAYRKWIIPGFESWLKRRSTFRHLRELEESQWWDWQQIESLQVHRLQELLSTCQSDSVWYRERWNEHGVQVGSVQSLSDLNAFPITTREMIRGNADNIRSSNPNLSTVRKSTGGSSGKPLHFSIECGANDRRVAATHRGYGWAGASPGTKQTHLWGVNLNAVSSRRAVKDYVYERLLYRRDMLNSFGMSDTNIDQYVSRLNRYRPRILVAYVNPLFVLARAVQEQGLSVHRPEAIIVGAEKLHDHQREMIERVFGSPIFETYGSREFTLIAAECDHHKGLHVTSENLIVEIVDDNGNACKPGEEGQVLVTDLFNTAMPFVRYAIGDRAVASVNSCGCGRGLPLLQKVVGRQADVLKLPDGRTLTGLIFPHLMKDFPAIRQFQVVQTHSDRIALKLVVDESWNDTQCHSLRDRVLEHIGESSNVEIQLVDGIELTAAGKTRVVVACSDATTSPPARIAI